MKVLKFLGSIVYGAIVYYLFWLLFYWVTPFIMNLGWGGFFGYLIGGSIVLISLASILAIALQIPLTLMVKGCDAAKFPPVIFALFFGYSSVKLPWSLDMDYGFLQYLLGISLTIYILIAFFGFAKISFDVARMAKQAKGDYPE